MELIIDVQGLKIDTNEIAFKELAVIDANDSDYPSSYLFKPPCEWVKLCNEAQRENMWLSANYHGLYWDSGHISYDDLETVLNEIATYKENLVVYVKGLQKKQWLQSYFTDVRNLEDYECPNLRQSIFMDGGPCCLYHKPYNESFKCAVKNVLALKRWLTWYRSTSKKSDSQEMK